MRTNRGLIILLLVVGLMAGHFELATGAEGTRLSPIVDRILAKKELVVGTAASMPPLNMTAKDGQVIGMEIDLARLIADNLEVKLTLKTMTFPELLPALETGRVDFVATTEPYLSRALEADCGILWMPAGKLIPGFQFACLVYGPSLLEIDPDLGLRFMIAYLAAVRQYNEGKSERNLEILARRTGLERDFLLKACWPAFRADGSISSQSIMDFQDWGSSRGFLDRPVSVKEFWEPRFVEQALRTGPSARQ